MPILCFAYPDDNLAQQSSEVKTAVYSAQLNNTSAKTRAETYIHTNELDKSL